MKNFFISTFLLFAFIITGCNDIDQEIKEKQVVQEQQENKTPSTKEDVQQDKNESTEDVAAKNDSTHLETLTVSYIDADQADATLFQFSDGKEEYTILYDVGDWIGSQVLFFLRDIGIEFIDLIIVSHPHADHIGQLEQVMNNFEVGEVWMSGNVTNTEVFHSSMEAVLHSEADYVEPKAGESFDIGPLGLTILHPKDLTGGLNEDSLSVRFTYGDISFLFTGDAYKKQEKMMLQQDLQADFLQLGHHGSNTSNDETFIEAVNPKYAIYSAGIGNTYGHPHDEVIQLLKSKGITLFGTDINGTITVKTNGTDYEVITEKKGTVEKGNKDSTPEKNTKENTQKEEMNHSSNGCININNASKEELMQITQIDEVRAEEMMKLRPFHSIDELTKINGIGDARLKEIKQQGKACVGGE